MARFVMLSAFVMGLGLATEARAQCTWNHCAEQCEAYCTPRQQTCDHWSFTGTCNAVMTCSYMCSGGSGLTYTCPGPSCGGGSPIFRKQETSVREGQAREDSFLSAPDRRLATPARRTDLAALPCP